MEEQEACPNEETAGTHNLGRGPPARSQRGAPGVRGAIKKSTLVQVTHQVSKAPIHSWRLKEVGAYELMTTIPMLRSVWALRTVSPEGLELKRMQVVWRTGATTARLCSLGQVARCLEHNCPHRQSRSDNRGHPRRMAEKAGDVSVPEKRTL